MFKKLTSRVLLCGLLAASGMLAAVQTADAAPARVRFTPPYGTPFPNLEWFGEAVVSDGSCVDSGVLWNFTSPCAGQFSFTSATVYLADVSAPTVALQTINFTGAQVIRVDRDSPAPDDWTAIYSSPFNPVKGTISQTLYDPPGATPADNAYFSLIFVGGYAQLYWFQKKPDDPLLDPLHFPYVSGLNAVLNYGGCYLAGPGDNNLRFNRCGLSSNLEGNANGAKLAITVVPEPESYALALASLATLGVVGFFSRRRSAKP